MYTWTIKQLNETSDLKFAICMLNERKNNLTNIYSPLSKKLSKAVATLEIYDKQTDYDIQFDHVFKMLCKYGELQTVKDDGVSTFQVYQPEGFAFMKKYIGENTGIKWDAKRNDWIKIYTSWSKA